MKCFMYEARECVTEQWKKLSLWATFCWYWAAVAAGAGPSPGHGRRGCRAETPHGLSLVIKF